MVRKKGSALLLVFTDVDVEHDAEFNSWYNEEHLPERLSAPGFLDGARYQAVKGGPRYLAVYELESAEALQSPEYKHQSQNPTERTKRFSPSAIGRGTVRSVCTQIYPAESDPGTVGRGMAPALQIGRMDVPSDIEARYNDYYDNTRTPGNLKVPGCLFVRRYHVVEGQPGYLTMYEFEHEKVPESLAWEEHRKQDTMHEYIGGSYGHAAGSPGVYRRIMPPRPF
ncbi:MAG: hypothetical protein O3A93_04475 [Chloroflexi bacterium]|nr:hypothetical protein [Chloroflexota bacterium]MDA1270500.1 hypothetical protein [Chloroflexota bacterium]PKB59685.1 MAG: hypothetical protein BZY83_00690 [SAR202 cluster bacterium Casp-Chloro-G2]